MSEYRLARLQFWILHHGVRASGLLFLSILIVVQGCGCADDDVADDDVADDDVAGDDTGDDDTGDDDTADDDVGDDDTEPPCEVMGCDQIPASQFDQVIGFSDMACTEKYMAHSAECVTDDWYQEHHVVQDQEGLETALTWPDNCAVDFEQHTVIGVSSGADTMDGHDYNEICEIGRVGNTVIVRYYVYIWNPHFGTGELYCPHHFVQIEKTDLEIQFEKHECYDNGT